jgi:transposase-like protein
MEEFNFEEIKNKALKQLKTGKSLLGKDGAFAPLLESILNAALEGEMDAHLDDEERDSGNRRNGKMHKQVQTPLGEVTVSTPRDRHSTFDPQFIKKRETILAENVADRIIGLYALGNSTRQISDWMEENLDKEGRKDVLGMYISKSEGVNFWLSVLTDLQNRGVHDILIACIDNLSGFADAIESVFPETTVQLCVVHQIRNSCKYVGSKHQICPRN